MIVDKILKVQYLSDPLKQQWTKIYAQVSGSNFEWTVSKQEAKMGDFVNSLEGPVAELVQSDDKFSKTMKLENKKGKVMMLRSEREIQLVEIKNKLDEHQTDVKLRGRPLAMSFHHGWKISPLERESRKISFKGLLNLMVILLILSNFRKIVFNFENNGWVVGAGIRDFFMTGQFLDPSSYFSSLGYLIYPICTLATLQIEKLASNFDVHRWIVWVLCFVNVMVVLVFPILWVRFASMHPGLAVPFLMEAVVFFMKFLSYHHVLHDVRHHLRKARAIYSYKKKEGILNQKPKLTSSGTVEKIDFDKAWESTKKEQMMDIKMSVDDFNDGDGIGLEKPMFEEVLKYPSQLNLKHMVFYLCVPTLCYQLKFPITQKRSYWKIFTKSAEMILYLLTYATIMMQYILPLSAKTVTLFKNETYLLAVAQFFEISIPNTYSWLLLFYMGFHTYLNLWAEVTGFADRLFYLDWWNSRDLGEYWRLWNLPVHHWLLRHIYFPMRRRKISRFIGQVCVFLFSAVFHEYIMAGAFQNLSFLAFNGMMVNLPVIMFQERFKKYLSPVFNNFSFWIMFCVIGQPISAVALMYLSFK